MILKSLLNFERKINIECPLTVNEFKEAYIRKYTGNKKGEFKGELERSNLKMWLDKDWFRPTDFSELNGQIETRNGKTYLKGKVELSDTITIMTLLGIIVLAILIAHQFISNGFDWKFLGNIMLMVAGFITVINIQLYREKQNFINEFKTLFRERLKKKQSG